MKVLFINRSDSSCGVCNKGAFPSQDSHETISGYYLAREEPRPGCGAVWTHVSSEQVGGGIEQAARNMRPDLIWVDFFETYQVE